MPNTGDATGSFDAQKALQDIYRAFQDNGVPILGLAKPSIDPGPPPTIHLTVNLQDGVPVATDPNTLPEGDSLPPSNGQLDVSLTQFNNSVGGYSWVASGTVTKPNNDTVTGTSTPGTGGLTSEDLNDPAKQDRWNDSLPKDAYEAIERVKQKLHIHAGRVGEALNYPHSMRRTGGGARVLAASGAAAAIGLIAGGVFGLILGTTGGVVQTPKPPTSAVTLQPLKSDAPPPPAVNTLSLNLTGNGNFTAHGTPCAGWPQSGTYPMQITTQGGSFSMSIQGDVAATGMIDAAGRFTAQNQFYKTGGIVTDDNQADSFFVDYLEAAEECDYDVQLVHQVLTGIVVAPILASLPKIGITPEPANNGGSGFPWDLVSGILLAAAGIGGVVMAAQPQKDQMYDPPKDSVLFPRGPGNEGGCLGVFDGGPRPPMVLDDQPEAERGDPKDVIPITGDSHGPDPPEVM